MNIVVDGLMTHYQKVGTGPLILLLHGWGDAHQTFESLTRILKKNYTVVSLDLPGFGKTDSPKTTFNLQLYAEFVHRFVDKLGFTEVYAIIGHSNGGAIAIKAIDLAELKPKKLILLASSGIRTTYTARKKALRIAAKTAKLPTKLMPKKVQTRLKKQAYAAVGSDLFVAEHLQSTFREVVGEDLLKSARNIQSKTLLLYGSEDTATLPAYGELFNKAIPNSEFHIIEGADHFLHHSYSAEIEKHVEEFLK